MDIRIRSLKITRSDYLKLMVLWDLDKGPDGVFDQGSRKPSFLPETKKRRKAS